MICGRERDCLKSSWKRVIRVCEGHTTQHADI